MNINEINNALEWRYATKRFDTEKKISPENWAALQNSLVKAPSSYGLQPWKFLVIENKELRTKLRPVTWGQSQVEEASHYVVFTSLKKLNADYIHNFIKRVSEVRGVSIADLAGYETMMNNNLVQGPRSATIDQWAQRQAYIAMGFLMETAALLGIDACPIEGLEPEQYNKILDLENSGYQTVAAVALGYRHPEDKYQTTKKVRFTVEDMIKIIR